MYKLEIPIRLELASNSVILNSSFYFEMYKFHDEISIRT
jgi:hypothetical protein